MPYISGDENSLKKEFVSLKKITKGFSSIDGKLISSNPTYIRIFRMIFGFTLEEMAEVIGKKYATVSQYERGKIKSLPIEEAERIAELIKTNLPDEISEEKIVENFRIFYDKAKGGLIKGMKSAEGAGLTIQESKIAEFLFLINASYKTHVTFETKVGPLNFDFVIKDKYVIECTIANNKTKAEALDYRIIKLKESYPELKAIAVIPKNVTNGFVRRLCDFDFIIFENEIDRLRFLSTPHATV